MSESSYRILIVDDDLGLRELLCSYRRQQDFLVDAVADAHEMDHYIAQHPVDLFILDLMLPHEDGFSIAARH